MAPSADDNLPSLTGLRWIAALLVFGYHLSVVEFFGPGVTDSIVDAVFRQGSVGVSFFFILSGFILMWSSPRTAKARFWYRRFARVYPLHAVTAALALVFLVLWKPQETPAPLVEMANLTLTQAWVPDVHFYQSLNTVSWTLSCEAFFYLTFPFFATAVANLRVRATVALTVLALSLIVLAPLAASMVTSSDTADWFFHWTPAGRFPEFLFGVALAHLVRLTHHRAPASLWPVALPVTIAGYAAATHAPVFLRHAACTALGFGLVLAAAAIGDVRRVRGPLAGPVLVRLGELSFAFYLIHLLVIRVVELIVGYHPRWDAPAAAGLVALTLIVSLGFSWLLHAAVENPSRRALIALNARPAER